MPWRIALIGVCGVSTTAQSCGLKGLQNIDTLPTMLYILQLRGEGDMEATRLSSSRVTLQNEQCSFPPVCP